MNKLEKAFAETILPALLAVVLTTTLMINAIQLRNCWEARQDATNVLHVDLQPLEQAPAKEPSKLKLTAPAKASVGQLVEVSANTGTDFKIIVKGVDPANVRILEHSVVFASPTATNVDVFFAAMVGSEIAVEHLMVQVGTLGLPIAKPIVSDPASDAMSVEIQPLISAVSSDDKEKEQREIADAFKQVAGFIKDGAVSSVGDAVRITQTMVKKATSRSKDAWKKVIDKIQDDTQAAADAGKLQTLEDHAKHWEAIANAVAPKI
jgi:hypothetical protein